ncbi:sterol desaturase family protein [Aquisalinus flavus]|uniref:Sterol desaturase n=1 Tax=Aquisalinus flavus TaxID=1526572 RepID=A0A8J2V3Y5_9PROT|nr:sterol desaturase family protein [Aquisalinus flavus]MBD0427061.1 sterol desaturase family protein [Aquisalinus flavus]UNE46887.1 sterol desaturase family protein [Aquisalinus flavus]GGC98076.1 sterol desaturase [Aquisalinus flavus]
MESLGAVTLGGFLVSYIGLTLIIQLRYVAIAGLFHWLLWGRPEDKVRAVRLARISPKRDVVRHEIIMSLISAFIYAAPAAFVLEMWKAGGTAIYGGMPAGLWGWLYLPLSAFLYMAIQDTWFYWTHRAMHHPALFEVMHRTHHKSIQPTPWAGFSFHPTEALTTAWLLPLCAVFIPIHIGVVLFLLTLMTVVGITNHAGWEIFPRWWMTSLPGRQMITATHHNLHHTRFSWNYGLYFRFWDQVMGTDTMDVAVRKKPVSTKGETPETAPAE